MYQTVYFPLAYSYTRFNSGSNGVTPSLWLFYCLLTQPKNKAFKEGMFAKFEIILDPTFIIFLMFSMEKQNKITIWGFILRH